MTIPTSATTVSRWVGNGITVQFDYDFKISAESELLVQITNADGDNSVTQVLNVDYTVSGVGINSGGQITLTTALTNLYWVVLSDNVGYSQDVPFGNQSNFFAENHESAFDKLTRLTLRLKDGLNKSIRIAISDDPTNLELPTPATRANKFMQFGTSGELLMTSSIGATTLNQATIGGHLWPQTGAEAAASVTPSKLYYEPGDVRRYGAVGDDSTNDAAAFQAAFDQNVRAEHDAAEIKSGPHTYYIVGALNLWPSNVYNRSWYAQNTVMRWAANTDGIVIGPNSADNQAKNCRIAGHLQVENDIDHTASSGSGLDFRNVRSGIFHVGAKKWQNGIFCRPVDSGFGYNRFFLGEMTRNNYGLYLQPGGSTGWCNSNSFHGGSFGGVTGQTYNWHIYIEQTTSSLSNGQPNQNRFHDCDFDMHTGATMSGAYLDEGQWNRLDSPRIEMNGTISVAQIKLAPQSRSAYISPGYDLTSGWETSGDDNNTVLDLGIENIVFGQDGLHISPRRGGYAAEVIEVKRTLPNTGLVPVIAAHDLYDDGGSPQGFLANLNKTRALAATQSWGFKVTQTGDLVSTGAAANDDLVYWECIDTHASSTSNTEPGVGSVWRDYWVSCKTDNINGGAAAAWSASAGTYTERIDVARITSKGWYQFGPITAPQIMTGTGAPGSTVAPRGSVYLRSDGGSGSTLYAKHGAGDSDWAAV
jgi:hypothetical protein